MAVVDLDGGQTRGGDPLLGHHGAVVAVGFKQPAAFHDTPYGDLWPPGTWTP